MTAVSQAYDDFLQSKRLTVPSSGFHVDEESLHPDLFPFQRDITRLALKKGRYCLWEDTGLGKTIQQLEWARLVSEKTNGKVLLLAPLAVARQTVEEAQKWGIEATYCRSEDQAPKQGIAVTSYGMLPHFDAGSYQGVVLDESSILQDVTGKTRNAIINAFRRTEYRLACSATPAPNDVVELGNHSEFMGQLSKSDMQTAFFVHIANEYELKGHAEDRFYQFLAGFAMAIKNPSDLGYDGSRYILPDLSIEADYLDVEWTVPGSLPGMAPIPKGVTAKAQFRRSALDQRCERAAARVMEEPGEAWILWYGLLDEGRRMKELLPDAVWVQGSMSEDAKTDALQAFAKGEIKTLITHPKIAGQGMNFQVCARMAFIGIGHSYRDYYQCIRRIYRFGQKRPVKVIIVLAEQEQKIYLDVLDKEATQDNTTRKIVRCMESMERAELADAGIGDFYYSPQVEMSLPSWLRSA